MKTVFLAKIILLIVILANELSGEMSDKKEGLMNKQ